MKVFATIMVVKALRPMRLHAASKAQEEEAARKMEEILSRADPDFGGFEDMSQEDFKKILNPDEINRDFAMKGVGKFYTWEQTQDTISFMMPTDAEPSDIEVHFPTDRTIDVKVKDEQLLDGEMSGSVVPEESFWVLEDGMLVVDIVKEMNYPWRGFMRKEGDASYARVTHKAMFHIEINGTHRGCIEVGLFGDDAPQTVANFMTICNGGDGGEIDEDYMTPEGNAIIVKEPYDGPRYAGAQFDKIVPDFMCRIGDVNSTARLAEEFEFRHDFAGLLSMGENSQFFFTFNPCNWLDQKNVVFGCVLESMHVLREIEDCGSQDGTPKGEIIIQGCAAIEKFEDGEVTSDYLTRLNPDTRS